jgi:crotonobetainyl-CoA:carnitine CoA-transferase CaiB-like acyl-CoA transferase
MAADPGFATGPARSANRDRLNAAIEAITRTRGSADWIERLNGQGVPSGPINSIDQVFADRQVRHLNVTRTVAHPVLVPVEVVGQAIELSRSKWEIRLPTPEAGEHTDAILTELGYAPTDIAALRNSKVV